MRGDTGKRLLAEDDRAFAPGDEAVGGRGIGGGAGEDVGDIGVRVQAADRHRTSGPGRVSAMVQP